MALASTGEPLRAFLSLPGSRALRQLVEAGAARAPSGVERRALDAAINQFERMVWDLGPSQSRLCARVRARVNPGGGQGGEQVSVGDARKRHFESSSALMGIELETHVCAGITREIPGGAGQLESIGVSGMLGVRAWREGISLSTAQAVTWDSVEAGRGGFTTRPLGTPICGGQGLIEEFSSKPAPTVTTRTEGGVSVRFLDTVKGGDARSDIVLASHRGPFGDPRADADPVYTQNTRIKYPARRLVLDLFVERRIAVGTPWSDAYLWHPAIQSHPQRNWHERLPGAPLVSVLGIGLGAAGVASVPTHRSMLAHIFAIAGWDADQFIGFRIETEYPIWGATYALPFVFGVGG